MLVTTAANFPSRYDIGDVVYFHPAITRMTREEARETAILAQVSSVTFFKGKVTYEIAVNVGGKGEIDFYHAIPVADVDSIFISSEDDLEAINVVSSEIGSSGEMSNGTMVALSYSIQEKLQRLAERRCPDDPEAEMKRMDEMARNAIAGYAGIPVSELRKAAQRFHCIKNETVMP